MSSFKKMRLISDKKGNKDIRNEAENIFQYETSSNLKKMSDLDNEISSILKSNIDEYSKSKLYSEALRKFFII